MQGWHTLFCEGQIRNNFVFTALWFLSQPLNHDIEEQPQPVHKSANMAGFGLRIVIFKPMLADRIITAISPV